MIFTAKLDSQQQAERRLVAVPVSFGFLVDLITFRPLEEFRHSRNFFHARCTQGLPESAVFVGSFVSEMEQTGYLVFFHPSFASVPQGQKLPEFVPVFEQQNCLYPIEGVRLELNPGEVRISYDPMRVAGQFTRPPQHREVQFEDGGRQMIRTGGDDVITLSSVQATPLKVRVRHVRDVVQNRARSFFEDIFSSGR